MNGLTKFFMQTKIILLLACVFLLSIWVMRMRQIIASAQASAQQESETLVTVTPTAKPAFNMNGTYMCSYDSITAAISHKKVSLQNKTATTSAYMIFDGDCIYSWQGKKKMGDKQCGYGQYMSLLDMAAGSGMIKPDSVISAMSNTNMLSGFLGASQSALLNGKNNSGNFIQSCKPVTSIPDKAFIVPKTIKFVEKKAK